jgi:hypothetical protein
MQSNHTQAICECYQQAAHCVQQAEAQNDPNVQKQFLELTRRWLLLAHGLTDSTATPPPQKQSDDRDRDEPENVTRNPLPV